MVALATAFVRVRLDTDSMRGDVERGLRGAGGEKQAHTKGKSIGAAFSKGFGDGGGSTFGRVAAVMASRVGLITTGLAAATPIAVKFVAALAPATGIVAGLVPASLGAAAASNTLKVAIGGTSDAIDKGLSGSNAYGKALENLVPAQRAVVVQIVGMQDQFDSLQQSVSQRFFKPIVDDIQPLADRFIPVLRTEMGALAGTFGQVSSEVLATARTQPVVDLLTATFRGTDEAVKGLGERVVPLIPALSRLGTSTIPILKTMTTDVGTLTARFTVWANEAARTGQLITIFNNARTVFGQLIAILANLGSLAKTVFGLSNSQAGDLLETLVRLTRQASEWAKSAQGAEVLTRVFAAMARTGTTLRTTLAGVLPEVAQALRIAAPAAGGFAEATGRILVSMGPLLPALTGVTVQLLTALIPAMNSFAGWMSRNQALLKVIAPLIVAYAVAARVAAGVTAVYTVAIRAWSLAVGVAKTAQALWTAVEWLAVAPKKVNIGLTKLSTSTTGTWIGVKRIEAASWLASTGATVKDTAAKVGNRIATLASAAASRVAAAATAAWALATKGAALAATAFSAVMKGVRIVMATAFGPISVIIIAIAALAAGLIYAYHHSETFRKIVDATWARVKVIISAVVEWFRTVAVPFFVQAIKTNVAAFQDLWGWVQRIWGWIKNYIQVNVAAVLAVFNTLKTFVTVTIPNAFKFMVNLVRLSIDGWRLLIGAGWDYIRGKFNDLRTYITQTLPNAFRSGVASIGKFWEGLKEKARTPITFVVKSVINPLIRGYNAIAKVFHAPTANEITGLASGGKIPGAASSRDNRIATVMDSGRRALGNIKVATGEFIVNAKSTAANLPLVKAINDARGSVFRRKVGGVDVARDGLAGFADGGGIGGFFGKVLSGIKGTAKFVTDPVGGLKKLFDATLGRVPGTGTVTDMVKDMARGVFTGVKSLLSGGAFAGGSFGSGWPSSPAAVRGDSGRWRKIRAFLEAAHMGGTFGNGYRAGDPKWHGSGWAVDWMGFNQDRLATRLAQMKPLELIHRTSMRDYAYTRGVNKGSFNNALMQAHRNHIHIAMRLGGLMGAVKDRLGNLSPVKLMDRGGAWKSGTMAVNNSGHTEQVLTGGPGGDIAELRALLAAILAVLQGLGVDVADALNSNTRRALQLGRSRGTSPGRVAT